MTETRGTYPAHLVRRVQLRDGSAVTIRPIRPEDAELERAFVHGLSDEARYFRFHDSLRDLTPRMLLQFTEIDYHDQLAFIAISEGEPAPLRAKDAPTMLRQVAEDKPTMLRQVAEDKPTMLRQVAEDKPTMLRQVGVARYVVDPGGEACEFAIVVTDEWQGRGLATALMHALMDAARARGVLRMYGDVLAANHKMLGLTEGLGFRSRPHPHDPRMRLVERKL
jgi:acetyltransferase